MIFKFTNLFPRIVAARLDGSLDFLEMETFQSPVKMPPPCSLPGRQKRGEQLFFLVCVGEMYLLIII